MMKARFNRVSVGLFAASLMCLGWAGQVSAAPQGFFVGADMGYLMPRIETLSSTTVTRSGAPGNYSYSIAYNTKHSYEGVVMGRAMMGYYFPHDSYDVDAFGIEWDVSFMKEHDSKANNSLIDPDIPAVYPVTTSLTSQMFTTVVDGLYEHDLTATNVGTVFKLGLAYVHLESDVKNAVTTFPTLLPQEEDLSTSGLGLSAGVGLIYNLTSNVGMEVDLESIIAKKELSSYSTSLGIRWSI